MRMEINVTRFIPEFKMATKSIDSLLLQELSIHKEGILAVTLSNRYNMSITDFIKFINKYTQEGIISLDKENKIFLTKEGIIYTQTYCFKKDGSNYLKKRKLLSGQIEINAPYIPDIKIINELRGKVE